MAIRGINGSIGMLVLAIWLVLHGLIGLIGLRFMFSGSILSALAIAAGVLLLMRK